MSTNPVGIGAHLYGYFGNVHVHVGEAVFVEHRRPEPEVLPLLVGGRVVDVPIFGSQVLQLATLQYDATIDFRSHQDSWLHDDPIGRVAVQRGLYQGEGWVAAGSYLKAEPVGSSD